MADISLGSLQRVQFEGVLFHVLLDVRGKVARTFCPFQSRFTIRFAIRTCFVAGYTVTSFAGLNDGITSPTVVGTAHLLHEDTFCSYFDGLTNHGNHPPFYMDLSF